MRVFRVFRFFRQLANWAMMILDSLKSLFGALILLGILENGKGRLYRLPNAEDGRRLKKEI